MSADPDHLAHAQGTIQRGVAGGNELAIVEITGVITANRRPIGQRLW
ncbi:MAG TPA: hypothetical protein VFT22_44295 [Kofleriaceae bacterium]|nr:hypothetical protein [Kofleriaceae bacterium]